VTKSNSRKSKSGNKKPQKTTAKTTALVPQAHGGALRTGGTPGNRGGSGRPPDVVRQRARDAFYTQIPTLEKIAEGKLKCGNVTPNFDQRIKAIDQLGKYGLPPHTQIVAAQMDTPKGRTFTLVLGEGDHALTRNLATPEQ